MAKRRINSCVKGKRGENQVVHLLRKLGFNDAYRTQQHAGKCGPSDVRCPETLPNVHIESKLCTAEGGGKVDLGRVGLDNACAQAAKDAEGKPWCVIWRPKGVPQWRMTMDVPGIGRVTLAADEDITMALQWLNERRS